MEATRRSIVKGALAVSVTAVLPAMATRASADAPGIKRIPSSGEALPLIGLGSWVTFNVGNDRLLLDESAAVIAAFFEAGGRMIDSSPMYGSSQPTIGFGLKKLGYSKRLFSAEKVWISNPSKGLSQIQFYLSRNPDYAQGNGLAMIAPRSAGNLVISVIQYLWHFVLLA